VDVEGLFFFSLFCYCLNFGFCYGVIVFLECLDCLFWFFCINDYIDVAVVVGGSSPHASDKNGVEVFEDLHYL